MLHIPFKGSSEAVVAAASGQVGACFSSLAAALRMLKAGLLRPIAFPLRLASLRCPTFRRLPNRACPGSNIRPGTARR
jgi:tripartite-type tricarboxylate transporter receptor subunit TctC